MAYAKAKKKNNAAKSAKAMQPDGELGTLIRYVKDSEELMEKTLEMSWKCRDYYDSKQLDRKERAALAARKQPAIVINRLKPKMDGLMGMERSNRTTAKAWPRTPSDEGAADAATEAIRFVLQDNFYGQVRSEDWENMVIEGTGGHEVIAEGKGEDVRLTINHIPWDRLVWDPHSRRKDFSDARYLGQVVWLDYDEAIELYPDGADVLQNQRSGESIYEDKPEWMDNTRSRCKIVELYYYKGAEVWYACFTLGGFLKSPERSPYEDEEGNPEWPYEFASLFVDRDGNRYGAAYQYLDVQDEINKRRSKALHLMSVRQTFATKGAVEDTNAARKELAKPDGHLEIAFGEFNKDFGILPTSDMTAAQFKMLEDAKFEMDAVGYNAAASGKDSRAMSGVALRNREAASQTELAPMFDVLKHMDVRTYRKVWNRIKQYWRSEKWIRVTNNEDAPAFVGLNAPMTKGEAAIKKAQAEGAKPEQLQQLAMQIQQDPSAQERIVSNDIGELDVDIMISDTPEMENTDTEMFKAVSEIVKSGTPPALIAELWPFGNKERIRKVLQSQNQVPEEVQKQMEEMKKQAQALQEENQALKSDQQTEMVKLQTKTQADQQKAQVDASIQAEEMRILQEKTRAEIQLAREKAEAEIKLKYAEAEANIALEKMKLQQQQEQVAVENDFKMKEQAKKDEAPLLENVMPQMTKSMDKMQENFEKSLEKLVGMATAPKPKSKKRISLIRQNGQTVGAEVEED